MIRFRTLRAVALAATFPLLIPVGHAAAQTRRRYGNADYSSRIDTTIAFDRNGSLTVNAGNGDVVITGWSRDQAHVHAVSEQDNIRFSSSSARLSLDVTPARRGSDTKFEISVPYGVRVMVTTWSGEISVRGTRGQVETHSQSGDIHVEDVTTRLDVNTLSGDLTAANVSGDADVNSISGDVKITDIRGNVSVGTVSGEVELRGVTASLVRARTVNGDVTYDGIIAPTGRYEINTHSGDIRLHVPRDASAQLNVSTWSGGINSDFPITLKPGEHGIGRSSSKSFTFDIGGGAARIAAETFSGDITVSSNGKGASRP